MLASGFRYRSLSVLVLSSAAVVAFACGTDDDKVVIPSEEAGAGGAAEAGAPSNAGSNSVAGAPSDAGAGPWAGGAAGEGGVGGAGVPALGGAGGEPASGGAPPVTECVPEGSVTALTVTSDAIYQGCRDGVVRAAFDAEDASESFQCCGAAGGSPGLAVPLIGAYDFDGGGQLSFRVPVDAAPGSYALDLSCPTAPGRHVISVQINEGTAPFIKSVNGELVPGQVMLIQGERLTQVDAVRGIRASDGQTWECTIDVEKTTDTDLFCFFPDNIPVSNDAQDLYFIDVVDDSCGAAPNPPPFWVIAAQD